MERRSGMRGARGFTLVELVIVVVVVGILAAIAYPSYVESIRKSRRAEAKTALLDLATRQERYFTTHNAYAATPQALGYGEARFPIGVRQGAGVYYLLSVAVGAGGGSWTASAAPAGAQQADRCGSFTLDHLGTEGNAGGTEPSERCW